MNKGRTSLTVVVAAGALAAAGAMAAPAQAAQTYRHVARTQPSWTSHARSTGNAAPSGRSSFRVFLAPRGGTAALQQKASSIATPGSSSYRHYLSASQFHAQFDPSRASADAVAGWLKSQHLKVTGTSAHRTYLTVSGTNAAVARAFHTQIKKYRHAGANVQANTTALSVPSSISGLVSSISGIDTTPHRMKQSAKKIPLPDGFKNPSLCSAYYGQKPAATQADGKTPLPQYNGKTLPYAVCGYTGTQYRGAYEGANPQGLDGSGVTVAITDAYASPTIAADAQRYGTTHGDGGYQKGQLTQTVAKKFNSKKACDYTGWYGEETLDVEAVHAMAPGANIKYYGAASCNDVDFLNTLQQVVDDNQATLVTNSWGEPELESDPTLANQYQQVFLQGVTQGVSFLFSSGDNGDEVANTGTKQADSEADDPWVTAVGGTSDAIGADNTFQFQTGWGTEKYTLSSDGKSWSPVGYLYGAGGGVSTRWNQPFYQKGIVPKDFAGGRAVPDVAMDADPTTGMLVGETQNFPDGQYYSEYRIGGTSLASPLFAGLTALRQQAAGPGYKNRLGFLNPTIYKNRGKFTDVSGDGADAGNVRIDFANSFDKSGGYLYSVRTFNQDSSLATAPGWDEVTGVGAGSPAWIKP